MRKQHFENVVHEHENVYQALLIVRPQSKSKLSEDEAEAHYTFFDTRNFMMYLYMCEAEARYHVNQMKPKRLIS